MTPERARELRRQLTAIAGELRSEGNAQPIRPGEGARTPAAALRLAADDVESARVFLGDFEVLCRG